MVDFLKLFNSFFYYYLNINFPLCVIDFFPRQGFPTYQPALKSASFLSDFNHDMTDVLLNIRYGDVISVDKWTGIFNILPLTYVVNREWWLC